MKNLEVSPKALIAWIGCAMLGPLALSAAQASWITALVTGILCSLLCVTIHGFSDGQVWKNRIYCGVLLLWNLYAAAVVASQSAMCWSGKGSEIAVALVLLALAALSSWNGAERASRVTATLCPLCVLIFAIILASGVGNVQWHRVGFAPAPPSGMLIFTFLLPIGATALPRRPGGAIARCMVGFSIFALLVSLAVTGTLSLGVALTQENGFFEFSKSLKLFSAVQRFEAICAVAVTLSLYAMLTLLLSGVGHLAEEICPGSGKITVLSGALLSGVLVVWKLILSAGILVVLALVVWAIAPVVTQLLPVRKKTDLEEKNP